MNKRTVKRRLKDAFCVRLNDGSGYVVWASKHPGPRGFEQPAIGYGKTAQQAWASVRFKKVKENWMEP